MENKTSIAYSILKWYSIVLMTYAVAYLFVTNISAEVWLSFIYLPVAVYLWSLVVRKLT